MLKARLSQRLQRYAWPVYIGVLLATAGSTLVVEAAIHGHVHKPSPVIAADSTCHKAGATHNVAVTARGFEPGDIKVRLCDHLVFRNQTNATIDIAVGDHDHHLAYPGLPEKYLGPGDSTTAVLRAKGTFELHDHIGDTLHAELTVTPQ